MSTETLPTRKPTGNPRDNLSRGFQIALACHLLVALVLIAAAYISHNSDRWGAKDPTAGAIQASMVNALPLPPRHPPVEKEVLASDNPSIAPVPPTPASEPKSKTTPEKAKPESTPKPNDVLIPNKITTPKSIKPTDKPPIDTAKHPPVNTPTPTPKATTGEAPATQIPLAVTALRNGTSAITVDDKPFGDRFAYYIKLVSQKANQSKAEGDPDGPETRGKRTVIRFVIQRDGTPADITVETRSGAPSLDTSTLRAIQRIETFGPLPAGDRLVIRYVYDSR
jgi:protein TonB